MSTRPLQVSKPWILRTDSPFSCPPVHLILISSGSGLFTVLDEILNQFWTLTSLPLILHTNLCKTMATQLYQVCFAENGTAHTVHTHEANRTWWPLTFGGSVQARAARRTRRTGPSALSHNEGLISVFACLKSHSNRLAACLCPPLSPLTQHLNYSFILPLFLFVRFTLPLSLSFITLSFSATAHFAHKSWMVIACYGNIGHVINSVPRLCSDGLVWVLLTVQGGVESAESVYQRGANSCCGWHCCCCFWIIHIQGNIQGSHTGKSILASLAINLAILLKLLAISRSVCAKCYLAW